MATKKKAAKKKTAKKKPAPHFQERREFIKRVLKENPKNYAAEMVATTKIFKKFDNDLDFLSKVKPPSFIKNSLVWFLTSEGSEFLNKKYKEFKYVPKKYEKPVDLKEKAGEDIIQTKPKNLRDFLNE